MRRPSRRVVCVGSLCVASALMALLISARAAICDEAQVARGRELFARVWQPQRPDAEHGDGLGPLFNARSCAECHKQGGPGGGGPNENNVQIIGMPSNRTANPFSDSPTGETSRPASLEDSQRRRLFSNLEPGKTAIVLHRFADGEEYEVWRNMRVLMTNPQLQRREQVSAYARTTALTAIADAGDVRIAGIRNPDGRQVELAISINLEERNTPPLFGVGQIESITINDILKTAAAQPQTVRGRPALLPDGRIGKFGWKAQTATLADFNENACAVELGLETPRFAQPKPPFVKRRPGAKSPMERSPRGLDMTADEVTALTLFTASLPAPRQTVGSDVSEIALGEAIFAKIGCAQCHVRDVGNTRGIYSDLLLHDLGASGTVYYGEQRLDLAGGLFMPARPGEFRTAPLWGVADSAPYMHDGRAVTLIGAIKAHQLQGEPAARAFSQLEYPDQQQLLTFLGSLRAP